MHTATTTVLSQFYMVATNFQKPHNQTVFHSLRDAFLQVTDDVLQLVGFWKSQSLWNLTADGTIFLHTTTDKDKLYRWGDDLQNETNYGLHVRFIKLYSINLTTCSFNYLPPSSTQLIAVRRAMAKIAISSRITKRHLLEITIFLYFTMPTGLVLPGDKNW